MSSSPKHKPRDPRDFYATPRWVADVVLESGLPPGRRGGLLYDPCAGDGALVAAGLAHGYNTTGVEQDAALVERAVEMGRPVIQGNGLSLRTIASLIINPPYSDIMPWLALARRAPAAAVLLRLDTLAGAKRYEWWAANPPDGLIILCNRPSFTGDGKTDSSDYCWVLYGVRPFGIRWANVPKERRR